MIPNLFKERGRHECSNFELGFFAPNKAKNTGIAITMASIFNAVRGKKDKSKMYIYFFVVPRYLWIFLFCFSHFQITAQTNLKDNFAITIKNWENLHDEGKYDEAIQQAIKAALLAEKLGDKAAIAIALNKEATSLLRKTRRVNRNRKKAKEKFERSLFYLATVAGNRSLRINNLAQLRWLAERDKDREQAAIYQNQIAEVKKLMETNAKNEVLAENKVVLENKVNRLAVQKKVLTKRVKSLSEAQLESELVIALQKNQVDSFKFELIRDSLILQQKELVVQEQATQLDLQQSHIDLQNSQLDLQKSQRNYFLALAGIIALLAVGAFLRYFETKKHFEVLQAKNEIIEEEKKKSEELLLNILPAVVANELKVNGVAKAKKYEDATVLFSDFKNFSAIAESLTPEKLVRQLDFYFKTFDEIIGKYQLEKIKTIGDAYMCVGGLPKENPNNPLEMVKAALEIQQKLESLKVDRSKKGEPFFEARIGIHTGPLVAGVVGSRKFAYDVWGDTVNVAARLESKSEAGKVNISAATYHKIKTNFACEFRGKIPIKNRGEVDMYFVKGLAN